MSSFYDIDIDFTSEHVKNLYKNAGMTNVYNKYLAQQLTTTHYGSNNSVYVENYVPEVHCSSPIFATYYPGTDECGSATSFQEKTLSN